MNPRANVSIADVYDPHYGLQLILLLCFLVPAILFLFTQHRTLQRIKPENRSMLPSLVWLQLIPVLGQLWQFFVVARISDSIGREMASRNEHPVFGADALIVEQGIKRPTKGIGLAYCILTVIPFLLLGHLLGLIGGLGTAPEKQTSNDLLVFGFF